MQRVKRVSTILLVILLLLAVLAAAICVLNYWQGKKRDALVADLRAQGILLDAEALSSTRPTGTKFYSGPWESSFYGFLFTPEAGKDLRVVQGSRVGSCDDIIWCGKPRG